MLPQRRRGAAAPAGTVHGGWLEREQTVRRTLRTSKISQNRRKPANYVENSGNLVGTWPKAPSPHRSKAGTQACSAIPTGRDLADAKRSPVMRRLSRAGSRVSLSAACAGPPHCQAHENDSKTLEPRPAYRCALPPHHGAMMWATTHRHLFASAPSLRPPACRRHAMAVSRAGSTTPPLRQA